MVLVSMLVGLVLIALGLGVYLFHPRHPVTSLIPAGFGALFLLLGFIARNHAYRKHAMHAAAALALLGVFGTVRGVIGVFRMISGGEVARPAAAIAQAVMAGVCIVFLILAIRSFINARRNPQGAM